MQVICKIVMSIQIVYQLEFASPELISIIDTCFCPLSAESEMLIMLLSATLVRKSTTFVFYSRVLFSDVLLGERYPTYIEIQRPSFGSKRDALARSSVATNTASVSTESSSRT